MSQDLEIWRGTRNEHDVELVGAVISCTHISRRLNSTKWRSFMKRNTAKWTYHF